MCSDPGTNNDGKGNLTSAEFSAWTNKCQWWNTETDRSEARLLHFSTQGISTDVLSMQVKSICSDPTHRHRRLTPPPTPLPSVESDRVRNSGD